jgi:hypothetical protein
MTGPAHKAAISRGGHAPPHPDRDIRALVLSIGMRIFGVAGLIAVLVACGPAPSPAPPSSGDGAWFCPKAQFETCRHTQAECRAAHPGDLCVLTRPVFCENDTTCYATRYDCEHYSICYAR